MGHLSGKTPSGCLICSSRSSRSFVVGPFSHPATWLLALGTLLLKPRFSETGASLNLNSLRARKATSREVHL